MATENSGWNIAGLMRRFLRFGFWCFVCLAVLIVVLVAAFYLLLQKMPTSYPVTSKPIPPPGQEKSGRLGGGLDGFSSPYLGHTGSWDGKGGGMGGSSKNRSMDVEKTMGLRWTFMPVNWRALEPNGPVDLSQKIPPAWQELDSFVIAAHARGLNVLMQAPVVGGNAGGPPRWAGRRESGKSAPTNMVALADFAGKLAHRYRPGGTLAQAEGWGTGYGVRAWELDNEPEGYLTSWNGQAGDYAEFVSLSAGRIKAEDPKAVIVAPGMASGKNGLPWLEAALDGKSMKGSPTYRKAGREYSIGPVVDVISFHNYEGLDSAFGGGSRTIGPVFDEVRGVVERWEQSQPVTSLTRKEEYWHTEGSYDFVGVLSASRRANWRFQFFTRVFACGIRKVCVMDASPLEQTAVQAYVSTLPNPFPMVAADKEVTVIQGQPVAFRHDDGARPVDGRVWSIWATANTGDAVVEFAVMQPRVTIISVDGSRIAVDANAGRIRFTLKGDSKMAQAVLVVDRAKSGQRM